MIPNELNVLVKHTLESALEKPASGWSLQGFGMLRYYLSPKLRLHVWHSHGKVDNVSTIHDHPWDFGSLVVVGNIRNVMYKVNQDAAPTHHMQTIRCGPGGCALQGKSDVALDKTRDIVLVPGDRYYQLAEELHESIPLDGTVTLVTREFKADTEHAHVCFPLGTEWVSAEPRPATAQEIEVYLSAALRRFERLEVQ